MKKLVLFGNTDFTKRMKYYVEHDAHRKVEFVVVDRKYIQSDTFENVPVVPFETFVSGGGYSPDEYEVLICVGYSRMNTVRQDIYNRLKKYKYHIASFIHSSVRIPDCVSIGEGNIILANVTVDLFSKIGNSNYISCGTLVAHNCIIGDFNTISANCSLSGFSKVKNNCFLGNNSTIGNHIIVNDFTLVGAGAYISKDTEANSVYVPERSVKLNRKSMEMNL